MSIKSLCFHSSCAVDGCVIGDFSVDMLIRWAEELRLESPVRFRGSWVQFPVCN